MKEAYCSYEVSELLKKKGFDGECTHYYDIDDGTEYTNGARVINSSTETYCTSPTHQMAMKWLRERNIGILPGIQTTQDPKECYWYASIVYLDKSWDIIYYVSAPSEDLVKGYDDVVEQALEYILKNLI